MKTVSWTDEQEAKIEEVSRQALRSINTWGPMHLTTLIHVLEGQGYEESIKNTEGNTANLAELAVWRLCRDKKIRAVQGKTVMLKRSNRPLQDATMQAGKVFEALKELGDIATPENLYYVLALEGFGKKTVNDAIKELRKTGRASYPFPLSPNRRVWKIAQ